MGACLVLLSIYQGCASLTMLRVQHIPYLVPKNKARQHERLLSDFTGYYDFKGKQQRLHWKNDFTG